MEIPFPDLVRFYISHVSQCALSQAKDTEELWRAIRTVREALILLATILGAFPRKKLEQITRLKRKALDLENSMHKVEKLGEDMVLLRLWCRNAQDAQLPIAEAVKLRALGFDQKLLPSLTGDLLLCAKLPYVVVRDCSEEIAHQLRKRVDRKFAMWKDSGEIPRRAKLLHLDGGMLEISSPDFTVKCVYDMKRWFVTEAKLFGSVSENFRTIIEKFPIKRAFEIASLCRLRQAYVEAMTHQKSADSPITGVTYAKEADVGNRLRVEISAATSLEIFLGSDGDLHASDEFGVVDVQEALEISVGKIFAVWAACKLADVKKHVETKFPTLEIDRGLVVLISGQFLVHLEASPKGRVKLTCVDRGEEKLVGYGNVMAELVRLAQ